MIETGVYFGTTGDALRIDTRGYLRCSIRITADDAGSGAVYIRRGYYGLGVAAYSTELVAEINGENPLDIIVDDAPQLVVWIETAGTGQLDVEWKLDTPAPDSWHTMRGDLEQLGRIWQTTQVPERSDRATVVATLDEPTTTGAIQLRAAVDQDGQPTTLGAITLDGVPTTFDIPPRSTLELFCSAKNPGTQAELGVYRIENPKRHGVDENTGGGGAHTHDATDIVSGTLDDARLSSNVPLLDQDNDWQFQQSFDSPRVEGVVGGFATGYTTLESDATASEVATFPNSSGEVAIVNDVSPANGELLVRSGGIGYISRVLEWSDIAAKYAGSSFPGSPADGQPFYRTDLDIPELFHYDATRGKWLGELRAYQFGRDSSASSGGMNLRFAGSVQMLNSRGLLTPVPLTIVGAELFNAVNGLTCDLDFYEASTNLTTLLSLSAQRGGSDLTLNYDLDADAGWPPKYPKINNITAASANNPIVVIYMRRRET